MFIQIIFMLCMYPILPIMYFSMKSEMKEKNGVFFGVRMRREWLEEDGIKEISAAYQKQLKKLALIFALLPGITFFIPYFSVSFTVWMLWLLAVIGAPAVLFARANQAVGELKKQKNGGACGWSVPGLNPDEPGAVPAVKRLPFMPPIVLSAAAAGAALVFFSGSGLIAFGVLVASFAAVTLLFFLSALWTDRQKIVISTRPEADCRYNSAKKAVWYRFWLILAWVNTGLTAASAFTLAADFADAGAVLWEFVIYMAVIFCICAWAAVRLRGVEKEFAPERKDCTWEDDDDCWIFGMLYYNPEDRHTLVSRRVGIGTTCNLATLGGKGMMLAGCLGILVISFSCIWLLLEDFTPITLRVENESLVAEHLKTDYEIPLKEITELHLLEETPVWSKVNGTSLDHLKKGTFYIRNEGRCQVFLNSQNAFFLCFTADGRTYYMSGKDDSETMEIWKLLSGNE